MTLSVFKNPGRHSRFPGGVHHVRAGHVARGGCRQFRSGRYAPHGQHRCRGTPALPGMEQALRDPVRWHAPCAHGSPPDGLLLKGEAAALVIAGNAAIQAIPVHATRSQQLPAEPVV